MDDCFDAELPPCMYVFSLGLHDTFCLELIKKFGWLNSC